MRNNPEEECFKSILESDKKNYNNSKDAIVCESKNTNSKNQNVHEILFAKLKKERKRLAHERNIPAYIIFNDKTLKEMSEVMPDSHSAMLQIWGVGFEKLRLYGNIFLEVVVIFKKDLI